MISVVVPTFNSERAAPRAFESLIAAAVDGLVREVIVADGGSTDETHKIADWVGAHWLQVSGGRGVGMTEAARMAKSDWLLFLHPLTALETGWEREVEHFIERVPLENPRAGIFRFGLDEFGASARREELFAHLGSVLFSRPRAEQSLLIPRSFYLKLGGHRDTKRPENDLFGRLGRARMTLLRARAVLDPAPN